MEFPLKEEENKEEPLVDNRTSKGGIKTLPFIIANEAFERVASFGLQPNMIFYLTRQYNMETRRATNVLFLWSAATNFLPVLGALLADSFVGRYVIIGCGCIASLLGTILLCCTTIFPPLRPSPCVGVIDSCEDAKPYQLLFLYTSFALISMGAGGIRASSLAFGADQVDKGDKQSGVLQSYFSWYYIALTISYLIALTGVVYIQDHLGWTIGFGVPAVLMLLSAISFYLAAPFYVKTKANNSLLIGLVRVAVASFTNRHTNLSPQATGPSIYHRKKDSMYLMPTERLRFLNKACVVRDPKNDLTPDGKASNPWSLCTVDQVEELKALIKVIPIWSTGIMIFVTVNQTSIPVLQANSMDRHINRSFEIPAGSFSIFMIVTLVLWLAVSDRIIYPITSKIRGKPTQIGLKMRMGIGLMCSVVAMAAWATAESVRRKVAIEQGITGDPHAVVHMSAMWLVPQYVFSGLGEAFHVIAQNEFFYTEFPKTMSSIASSLNGVGQSVATLAASFILNAVNYLTTRGGNKSWVTSNINNGHYDYYFWLLAGLSVANLLYYIVCSKAYGPCNRDIIKVVKEKNYLEGRC